jgi:hypothetical protein
MITYEIRVTDNEDASNFATLEYVTDDQLPAGEIIDLINRAIDHNDGLEFQCGKLFVTINAAADQHGYMYDIFASKQAYDSGEDAIDGGLCTGTLSDAIAMAIH